MLTLKNILCPVDFSDVSRAAFRHAVALAAGMHGVVRVIHVVDASVRPMAGAGFDRAQQLATQDRRRSEERLRDWLAEPRVQDVPVEFHLVEGTAARAIVEEARALSCDAIVMGTHGRSGIARALLGSVAEKVVRTATVPTLVVPSSPRGGGAPRAIASILCPVDFSEISERALSESARLARALGAALHVVHCWELEPRGDSEERETRRSARDFSSELAALTDRCVAGAPTVQRHLRHGVPHVEIVDAALALDVELIVMGTNGRTGLEHLLIGSVAERVIRVSPIPVLTLRTPALPS
ncbi:MAG: universal stress protein [Myxococcota bacterium]|nr:universal stress protein [Myxococcota bacterium]